MMQLQTALEIVRVWLREPFDGGRHLRRIQLIDKPTP
jgi:ribose 5-phosphate isomerase RpiB